MKWLNGHTWRDQFASSTPCERRDQTAIIISITSTESNTCFVYPASSSTGQKYICSGLGHLTLGLPLLMSSNKRSRPFDWFGVPGSWSSSKRLKSFSPPATSSNAGQNQASNVPSILSSKNIPHPGASTSGPTIPSEHAMLLALKGSMKLLEKACGIFPTLESAVEGLVAVLDSIEVGIVN